MKPTTTLVPLLFVALKHFSSCSAASNPSANSTTEVIDLCEDDVNVNTAYLVEEDLLFGLAQVASSSGVNVAVPVASPSKETRKRKAEVALQDTVARVPEVKIDNVKELSTRLLILDLGTIKAHLQSLGDKVMDSFKEHCNWNLLHEAVYTDNVPVARLLLEEFAFDPNAFDPQFGSAVYLIKSKAMAELLREFRGNLNDQRPCALYASALDSARSRGKLDLVSVVQSLQYRSVQLATELPLVQSAGIDSVAKFDAPRPDMFKIALSTISRRKIGTSNANVKINFKGEDGIDVGGLTVEFINLMKDEIIASENVLVYDSETGYYGLLPDSLSLDKIDPVNLSTRANEIRFLGFIVGLSIYHKVPLNMVFSPLMYQMMCDINPHRDIDMMAILKETDYMYYQSLTRLSDVSETYVSDYVYPEVAGNDLRPWKAHRGSIASSMEFNEYIPLAAKHKAYAPYAKSLSEFKIGLNFAISTKTVGKHLTPTELKTILLGESDYTAAEWRAACVPTEIPEKYQQQYEWFWRAIDEVTREERASILKFVTALVSLPIGGFKALDYKPSVHVIDEQKKIDFFPRSSTCFNQIRMYPVSSYEKMKEVLVKAAALGSSGFGDK